MYTNPDFESMNDEQIVSIAQEADGAALEYLLNKTATRQKHIPLNS